MMRLHGMKVIDLTTGDLTDITDDKLIMVEIRFTVRSQPKP